MDSKKLRSIYPHGDNDAEQRGENSKASPQQVVRPDSKNVWPNLWSGLVCEWLWIGSCVPPKQGKKPSFPDHLSTFSNTPRNEQQPERSALRWDEV